MITLATLRTSDAALPGGSGRAEPGDAADGFLALLGDALAAGADKKSPLKGKLLPVDDSAVERRTADDEKPALTAALPLPRSLAPAAAAGDRAEKTSPADKPGDDGDPAAALGALLAMLPQVTPPPAQAHAGRAAVSAAPPAGGGRSTGTERPADALPLAAVAAAPAGQQAPVPDADARPIAIQPAAAPAPAAADISPAAAPPAPVISAATATVNTHPVVTVNAQLGTPEWQQSVSQHITLFTRQGQHSAELKLHPQDLGQVTISMKVEDNQAQLQMVSGHGHVRAALEAALPQLRSQLADSGIQLTQSSISSDASGGQQQSAFQQPPQPHFTKGNGFTADDSAAAPGEESLSAPAALQLRARGDGAVDTFA
ncbi:flagellar hook-length control protein FliK [Pluralibacter gergoviae]|uniref:flagellar hook-length control protein FliK n=1 Tax=Pluralibacter gergoviae TaxID=61647 RepID=UPI00259DEFD6|nr:flagellar hook-length control protein FliK [Pluralibacter gergoviae]EKV0929094.1 flagellar hook-length control protein FliK [Pluralibacter gergoviae]EKV6245493.1 flagellar hook-length control protein FliK [Pluralibacter gergoviae]ELD4275240.1 flagellar hook-length control protein FliK [Pluralibacter gergoviae]MDU4003060.1 flagellar hook-length control protein FliK [Pluralibacter gergoviae]